MKTLMRIISVLTLITGVISLAAGGMNIGVIYSGFGETLTAILSAVIVLLLMVGGLMDVICGLLGLRAAKRPGGSTAAIVFGVLAVIPGAVNIAINPTLQHVLGIVLPALYLICAIALKAKKQEEEVK